MAEEVYSFKDNIAKFRPLAGTGGLFEGGTFTPTLTGAIGGSFVPSYASGVWQKVGNIIFWNAMVAWSSTGTAFGVVSFGGNIPFAPAVIPSFVNVATLLDFEGIAFSGMLLAYTAITTPFVVLLTDRVSGGSSVLRTVSDFSPSGLISIGGFFFAQAPAPLALLPDAAAVAKLRLECPGRQSAIDRIFAQLSEPETESESESGSENPSTGAMKSGTGARRSGTEKVCQ